MTKLPPWFWCLFSENRKFPYTNRNGNNGNVYLNTWSPIQHTVTTYVLFTIFQRIGRLQTLKQSSLVTYLCKQLLQDKEFQAEICCIWWIFLSICARYFSWMPADLYEKNTTAPVQFQFLAVSHGKSGFRDTLWRLFLFLLTLTAFNFTMASSRPKVTTEHQQEVIACESNSTIIVLL